MVRTTVVGVSARGSAHLLGPLLLLSALGGLALEVGCGSGQLGGSDGGSPSGDAGGPPRDRGTGADLSGRRPVDGGGCSPLPARCLCPEACQAGSCDNARCPCAPIPGESYSKIGVVNPYGGDVSKHVDINLLLRQWRPTGGQKGIMHCDGDPDYTPSPQLYSLFEDERVPLFTDLYQIDAWDWSCSCAMGYVTAPEATLAAFAVTPGEIIRTPFSGYTIMPPAYGAMVLYAAPGTITIKYTPEDSVAIGYTIHLFGICVEPALLALYQQCNAAGRQELPGLNKRQPLGRALGDTLTVAIRDTGSWMEPRCRLGWWIGK